MRDKVIDRLVTVKSILTIVLTVVFAVLCIKGTINPSEFMAVFMTVVGFYFGTQKKDEGNDNGKAK